MTMPARELIEALQALGPAIFKGVAEAAGSGLAVFYLVSLIFLTIKIIARRPRR
jgi:hypothetical protein